MAPINRVTPISTFGSSMRPRRHMRRMLSASIARVPASASLTDPSPGAATTRKGSTLKARKWTFSVD